MNAYIFSVEKGSLKLLGTFICNKKLPYVINRPIGENSPNLVKLAQTAIGKKSEASKSRDERVKWAFN
jgi:hypothetical protein